uniref:Uncharacterized protein n=1 Tax=Rhizophora mucronata TaxID=61149 RepID=A0A2P2QU55_RHIMU
MAGLEGLRKKLIPLFDAEEGLSAGSSMDPNDSYTVIFIIKIPWYSVVGWFLN